MISLHRLINAISALFVTAGIPGSTGAVSPRTPHDVVNVTMWQQWGGGHGKATLDKYIALFNRTHPGIHVSEIAVTDNSKADLS